MILRQALILSARRDYVQGMRESLRQLGNYTTRIDVEMDGLRAMQLAPRQYDLVVLDAVMEAMDGVQLMLLMKLQAPTTTFVVVGDVPGEEARALAYQNGADLYLLRPSSPAAWENAAKNIRTLLEGAMKARRPEDGEEPAQRLTDVVQTRCLSGDSVILSVQGRFQQGDIFIYRGEIFHAQYPGKSGVSAFYDMSRWDDGLVRVKTFRLTNIPPRTIETPYRALLEGVLCDAPSDADLRPPVEAIAPEERETVQVDPTWEAPSLPPEPLASPFLPDVARPDGTPMPPVEAYWKVNLMGELVEGSGVTDPDRCALLTNFFYRKLADVAVALEVDYFDTLVLRGPLEEQVLVADNFGVRHAIFGAAHANEPLREQFLNWCREQSL